MSLPTLNILKESSASNLTIIKEEPNQEILKLKPEPPEEDIKNNNEIEKKAEWFTTRGRPKFSEEERKQQIEDALKGLKKLLGISTIYSKFLQERLTKKDDNLNNDTSSKSKGRARPSKKNEESATNINVSDHLKYFDGGTLRPYQLKGVEWIMNLYVNSVSGILGDEMGLGKTIQVIALISHLIERGVKNRFLILVPLSTLSNWMLEFQRFAPKIPVISYHAPAKTRHELRNLLTKTHKLDNLSIHGVVITTYEMVMNDSSFLSKFMWEFIIIDEGHRVKNHNTKLARVLQTMKSKSRLILTGTPLQNTVTELWALFNFLMPEIFKDDKMFTDLLLLEDLADKDKFLEREGKSKTIETIQKVLGPFMLRRLKKDVEKLPPKKEILIYCPLSALQKNLYTYTIDKDIEGLFGVDPKEAEVDVNAPRPKRKCTLSFQERARPPPLPPAIMANFPSHAEIFYRITMGNRVMMYRKIVNHPYLIQYPLLPGTNSVAVGEDLITNSGKMMILSTLLEKLKRRGHKVLIFCTLVMMIDLVEDFFTMRDYQYRVLTGKVRADVRQERMVEFNNDPDIFAFLISTKAGGHGVNLVGADTIIFIDRDWNPQVDIQAMARCHRIGQTRPVVIYTLVVKNTVDDNVLARGEVKRRLEKLVIREGTYHSKIDAEKYRSDLMEIKRLLESEGTTESVHSNGFFSEEEWDKLLDRSDMYKEMAAQSKENQI